MSQGDCYHVFANCDMKEIFASISWALSLIWVIEKMRCLQQLSPFHVMAVVDESGPWGLTLKFDPSFHGNQMGWLLRQTEEEAEELEGGCCVTQWTWRFDRLLGKMQT